MHDLVCVCACIHDIMLNRALEKSECYRRLRVTEPCPAGADLCVYVVIYFLHTIMIPVLYLVVTKLKSQSHLSHKAQKSRTKHKAAVIVSSDLS